MSPIDYATLHELVAFAKIVKLTFQTIHWVFHKRLRLKECANVRTRIRVVRRRIIGIQRNNSFVRCFLDDGVN